MFPCDAITAECDLFALPQALNFRKQSASFDVLAKHCICEVYIKKIYGNPITVGSSEHCDAFSAKYLYTEEQADFRLILGTLNIQILADMLTT